jgi:hypothetical protein
LQVILLAVDLPETLLWLVLRIPARHWYKGDTAVPALHVSAAMRGCVTAPSKSQPSMPVLSVAELTTLAKSE